MVKLLAGAESEQQVEHRWQTYNTLWSEQQKTVNVSICRTAIESKIQRERIKKINQAI